MGAMNPVEVATFSTVDFRQLVELGLAHDCYLAMPVLAVSNCNISETSK